MQDKGLSSVGAGVTAVIQEQHIGEAVLFCVFFKEQSLILNAVGVALEVILLTESAASNHG
jgi:hypothetical protein